MSILLYYFNFFQTLIPHPLNSAAADPHNKKQLSCGAFNEVVLLCLLYLMGMLCLIWIVCFSKWAQLQSNFCAELMEFLIISFCFKQSVSVALLYFLDVHHSSALPVYGWTGFSSKWSSLSWIAHFDPLICLFPTCSDVTQGVCEALFTYLQDHIP